MEQTKNPETETLRINLNISDRREGEFFNRLKNTPVSDRASLIKYWAHIGYALEKGELCLAPKETAKPQKQSKQATNARQNERAAELKEEPKNEEPASAQPKEKENSEIQMGVLVAKGYGSSMLGGAEDLGLDL